MPRRSIPERLALLETQTLALKARLVRQTRAEQTRRRILLGGLLEQALEANSAIAPTLRDWLREVVPAALPRQADRALLQALLSAEPGAADRTPPPDAASPTNPQPPPSGRRL
jgi:hypothetical protein